MRTIQQLKYNHIAYSRSTGDWGLQTTLFGQLLPILACEIIIWVGLHNQLQYDGLNEIGKAVKYAYNTEGGYPFENKCCLIP